MNRDTKQTNNLPTASKLNNQTNTDILKTPTNQPNNFLHNCQFKNNTISCGVISYIFQSNQKNSTLSKSALDESNKLNLKNFRGDTDNQAELYSYLTEAYRTYIEKMITIGLGAETFSFNKFAYFFNEHQQHNIDFAARFEKMFFYLKADKKNIAVNTQHHLPSSLDFNGCTQLHDLIACYQQGQNLVFKKHSI